MGYVPAGSEDSVGKVGAPRRALDQKRLTIASTSCLVQNVGKI